MFKAIICVVTSFALLSFAVSKFIKLALSVASSSKSSFVEFANAFSDILALSLSCAASISLAVISSSSLPASCKNSIRSCRLNFSLSTALLSKSARSLLALALSTKICLSNLSALALWSAIPAATLASFTNSFVKLLTEVLTLLIVSFTPVKLST